MSGQTDRIARKIEILTELDRERSVFGSQQHGYVLNRPLAAARVLEFESKHQVTLPRGYVDFLTAVGNGGVGPFYGLEPLERSLFSTLGRPRPDSLRDPSKPFPYTEPWNLDFPAPANGEDGEERDRWIDAYNDENDDDKHVAGTVGLCHYGCGVSLALVVNGQEYGHVWADDRASDGGIYPFCEFGNKERVTFLEWYELWLDGSICEVSAGRANTLGSLS